jgi:hypothetical protein
LRQDFLGKNLNNISLKINTVAAKLILIKTMLPKSVLAAQTLFAE